MRGAGLFRGAGQRLVALDPSQSPKENSRRDPDRAGPPAGRTAVTASPKYRRAHSKSPASAASRPSVKASVARTVAPSAEASAGATGAAAFRGAVAQPAAAASAVKTASPSRKARDEERINKG